MDTMNRRIVAMQQDLIEEGCSLCSGLIDLAKRTLDPSDKALLLFVLDRLPEAYPLEVRTWLNEMRSSDMD